MYDWGAPLPNNKYMNLYMQAPGRWSSGLSMTGKYSESESVISQSPLVDARHRLPCVCVLHTCLHSFKHTYRSARELQLQRRRWLGIYLSLHHMVGGGNNQLGLQQPWLQARVGKSYCSAQVTEGCDRRHLSCHQGWRVWAFQEHRLDYGRWAGA